MLPTTAPPPDKSHKERNKHATAHAEGALPRKLKWCWCGCWCGDRQHCGCWCGDRQHNPDRESRPPNRHWGNRIQLFAEGSYFSTRARLLLSSPPTAYKYCFPSASVTTPTARLLHPTDIEATVVQAQQGKAPLWQERIQHRTRNQQGKALLWQERFQHRTRSQQGKEFVWQERFQHRTRIQQGRRHRS